MSVTWTSESLSERASRRRGYRRLARQQRLRRRERVESILLGVTLVAILLLGASASIVIDALDAANRRVQGAVFHAVEGSTRPNGY